VSEYKINYYHADSLVGHFYVQFEGQLPLNIDGKGQKIFGKNPAIPRMPIAAGKVVDESKIHIDKNVKKILASTSVTREQFESAYQFAVNSMKDGGLYHGTLDNCINFNQQIFAASGGKGHFINLFPKSKLEADVTAASQYAMQYYESNSYKSVTGLTADFVALRYGVSKDRIVENHNLNVDLAGRPTLDKTFTIMPENTQSSNTPSRDSGIFINNQASHFANPLFHNYQPSYLSGSLFSQPSFFMGRNYMHEPSWLYTKPQVIKNGLGDFMKYQEAKQKFQSLVWSCVRDNSCKDTISSLADRAVRDAYSSSLFVPFSIKSDLYSSASSAAMGWSGSLSSVSLSRTGYTIGSWTHPLRSELKYAASHVSPLVLDLNGDGIKLFPYTKGVYFDIDNDGFMEKVGWVSPEDG
jgi:hypothetical protein